MDYRPWSISRLSKIGDEIPGRRVYLYPETEEDVAAAWNSMQLARCAEGIIRCPRCGNADRIRVIKARVNPRSPRQYRYKCKCHPTPFTFAWGTFMGGCPYAPSQWLEAFGWLFARVDASGRFDRRALIGAPLKNLKEALSLPGRPASNRAVAAVAKRLAAAWESGELDVEVRQGRNGKSYWGWRVRSPAELPGGQLYRPEPLRRALEQQGNTTEQC